MTRVIDWLLAALPLSLVGSAKLAAMERLLDRMEDEQAAEDARLDAIEDMLRARASVPRGRERPT